MLEKGDREVQTQKFGLHARYDRKRGNFMDTLLSTQRELDQVQRLLACFIFEVQVYLIENEHPIDILDVLATLVEHAPPSVKELVERLRRTPPEEQENDYPDTLPSFVDNDSVE
jgi:hypothetical protein